MSFYGLIKAVHVGSMLMSISLFFVRGLWMMRAPARLAQRWVRVLPHIIDTVLLASALTLVFLSRQYPFVEPWLTAKVVALLAYILIGMFALRRGPNRATRITAWFAALLVFAYIVGVALTRNPWVFAV
ncbi:MAG: SirB2 family protein [Thiohalobacteraceae bacterium]|nr:SirB2 family protein [Gammaproteobacteria bacterium]